MLPLDKLSEAAILALTKSGHSLDSLSVAVQLDRDLDGNFGEFWLVYDSEKKHLIRLIGDANTIPKSTKTLREHQKEHFVNFGKPEYAECVTFLDEIPYDYYSDMIVDNLNSKNCIYMLKHNTPRPDTKDMEKEEADKIKAEWNNDVVTTLIACCSNRTRQRLLVFRDISERLYNDETVTEEDKIFDQFIAKCPKCHKPFPDQIKRSCPECSNQKGTLPRMLSYLKDYKFPVFMIGFTLVLMSAISLVSPILSGQVLYDEVLDPKGSLHSLPGLFTVLSLIVGLALFSMLINILHSRATTTLSVRLSTYMKQKVYEAIMGHSVRYFNTHSTGFLITRVTYDADRIMNFYTSGLPSFIIHTIQLIGVTVFMFFMNWKMTLLVFTPVPFVIFMLKVVLPRISRLYTKAHRAEASMSSQLNGSLSGIRVVKAFAKEADETARYHRAADRVYHSYIKLHMANLTVFPVIGLLIGLSSQAIWGYGGLCVMGQDMTYGDFTTYLGYIGMIFAPLQFYTNFTSMVTDTLNSASRMFEVLDETPEITDAPDAVDLPVLKGEIEFKDVNFHYDPTRPILKDINIKIHAGDNIGLVGHTGCGKSTLANLITRMYDTVSGTITIDGVDVRNIKQSCLRKNIAIVSQEIFLFTGTIADNIRYSRPDATMEEVIAAAQAANAHDFILALKEGYDTKIGNYSLSGGERQRISIARAILTDPSILILDEATAAMDTQTERLISDALAQLVKGRTCLSIAHRLSTLKDCNYLFAIENGHIAEEGSPEELLAKKGVYYKLYTLQNEAMKRVLNDD